MTLPTLYKPSESSAFIGPAREAARIIENTATACVPQGAPIKFMLNGDPGIGKSALADYLIHGLLKVDQWNLTKKNGTTVTQDWVTELSRSFQLSGWFDGYRVVWIEEADKIPAIAQVNFLTLLDDLPKKTAVVCTSNCTIAEFQKRFQTRFTVIELEGPTANEVYALMAQLAPYLVASRNDELLRIAELSCGCVRQALHDLQSLMMACPAPTPATK